MRNVIWLSIAILILNSGCSTLPDFTQQLKLKSIKFQGGGGHHQMMEIELNRKADFFTAWMTSLEDVTTWPCMYGRRRENSNVYLMPFNYKFHEQKGFKSLLTVNASVNIPFEGDDGEQKEFTRDFTRHFLVGDCFQQCFIPIEIKKGVPFDYGALRRHKCPSHRAQ